MKVQAQEGIAVTGLKIFNQSPLRSEFETNPADAVDQVAGGGKIPDRLGDISLAQGEPVAGQTAVADPTVGAHMIMRRAQFADGHELPVLLVERSDFIFQRGEQPRLDPVP